MSWEEIIAVVSIGIGLGAQAVATAFAFGILYGKVQALWHVVFKVGVSELLAKGMGTMNSPLEIHPDELNAIGQIKTDLRNWYVKNASIQKWSDADLMQAIEKEFGSRLMPEIGTPKNIQYIACLLVAAVLAKDETTLRLPGPIGSK